MKNKMMLLALGLLALVSAALPAVASAGEPVVDAKALTEGKSLSFTSAGTHAELRAENEPTITCTGNSGTGKYTTSKTGEIALTFTGCKDLTFGSTCTSSGQAPGTIVTGTSVFHNVYLTDAKTTPGVLVTPPSSGVFASFTCGGFFSSSVGGNGIIGHLSSPKCGETKTTATLSFTATTFNQTYKQVTATGTSYSLTNTTAFGGTAKPAAEVAEGTVTYAEPVTLTCV
jgi:hypothetical protein